MNIENAKAQMRKGVLELCILSLIKETPAYVPDLMERLQKSQLAVVEGTLYPLLTRLKNSGVLTYKWQESKSGPPRKYYELTTLGKLALTELEEGWNQLVESVNITLNQQPS
jgi:PadR family transcriptional regulator, regulatory protein PadR